MYIGKARPRGALRTKARGQVRATKEDAGHEASLTSAMPWPGLRSLIFSAVDFGMELYCSDKTVFPAFHECTNRNYTTKQVGGFW